jgi:mannose-6-phosphate isomerase-like protein (cupin superfamily)
MLAILSHVLIRVSAIINIMNDAINLNSKFGKFDELWSPKIIAQMNNNQFKLAKFKGDFVWHDHPNTDEVFIVIKGKIRIDYRDKSVDLNEGEMHVVQKGIEHKPYAENEAWIMLVEPAGTINTGETNSDKTAPADVWI